MTKAKSRQRIDKGVVAMGPARVEPTPANDEPCEPRVTTYATPAPTGYEGQVVLREKLSPPEWCTSLR